MRAGRPGIEKQWRQRSSRMPNMRPFLKANSNGRKIGVIARPAFRFRKNNRTQDFAALHLRRLFFLLCRLGMKRALVLRRGRFRREGSERAMIRDRDPGTDGNYDNHAAGACIHDSFNSTNHRDDSSIFFGQIDQPRDGGVPEATPPADIASLGSAGLALVNCGCSTRVANSIAVNKSAAAR